MIADTDRRPSPTEQRWFGLLLLVVFSALGGLLGWQLESLHVTQAVGGLGLALAALYYGVRPLRAALYRTWMALTMPLGRLVSTLVLAVVYFLTITPIALVMRVFGRDRLGLQVDRSTESYWEELDTADEEGRYFRQS